MDQDRLRFHLSMEELRRLLLRLADLQQHVIVVGAQVIALELAVTGGDGEIFFETPTGIRIPRGYTSDVDLLFDIDAAGPRADGLTETLREMGFARKRDYRWVKQVSGLDVIVDVFRPEDADPDNDPLGCAPQLVGSELAFRCPQTLVVKGVRDQFEVRVPDPLGYLATKVAAKAKRSSEAKDCFDLYTYLVVKEPARVAAAVRSGGERGQLLLTGIMHLFGSETSEGVKDVLSYARSLGDDERALLAQAVVDLFEEFASLASKK